MKPDDLRKLQQRFPLSASTLRRNTNAGGADPDDGAGSKPAVVEPAAGNAAAKKVQPEEGHATRYLVRVVDYRLRLLDEDNLCAKFVVDALRYCGFLPTDAPGRCKIQVGQQKVFQKKEVRVEIEIYPPGTWIDHHESIAN